MRKLNLPKVEAERSAKQFLLVLAPSVLTLFDVPQKILGFNVQDIVTRQIYAMSEESARRKLDKLKEMLEKW